MILSKPSTMRPVRFVSSSVWHIPLIEYSLNLWPNRVGARISQDAQQAGLGTGYGGESPWMGMLVDLESIVVELLGEFSEIGSR